MAHMLTLGLGSLLLCTAPLLGQTTWVVDVEGGGDFTSLQAAVNAASDGDTLLVNYWSGLAVNWNFTLTKALTIVGVGYDRAEVLGHLVIAGLTANQQVVLRSLQRTTQGGYAARVTVQNCAGAVVFDDVALDGTQDLFTGDPGLIVTGSDHVGIGRSDLRGHIGLSVAASVVTCTDSSISGSSVVSGPGVVTAAVSATGSRLWFAQCVLAGGSNMNLGGFAGPGQSGLVLQASTATLAATDALGGYGLSGFAASATVDAASTSFLDAATWLRDGSAGAGSLVAAETGSVDGGLTDGAATFTLDAAADAYGVLIASLPGPELATPFGPSWMLPQFVLPLAADYVPIAVTVPPLTFLPHGFPFALQGVVLHGPDVWLSTPLLTTVP